MEGRCCKQTNIGGGKILVAAIKIASSLKTHYWKYTLDIYKIRLWKNSFASRIVFNLLFLLGLFGAREKARTDLSTSSCSWEGTTILNENLFVFVFLTNRSQCARQAFSPVSWSRRTRWSTESFPTASASPQSWQVVCYHNLDHDTWNLKYARQKMEKSLPSHLLYKLFLSASMLRARCLQHWNILKYTSRSIAKQG